MNRTVLIASLLVVMFAVSVHGQDKPPVKGQPEVKPIVIQIDGSKLPPDVLKRLLELSQPEKGPAKGPEPKPMDKKGSPTSAVDEAQKKLDQALEELAAARKQLEAFGQKGPATVPPGLAKKPEPKETPVVKTISLTEAIAIAEKTAKGTATKAERKGEGAETHFKIDVVNKDGEKQKVELTPDGKVRPSEEKKDDDDDDDKKKPSK
jgi:uncharacterized membrane protein YkoI